MSETYFPPNIALDFARCKNRLMETIDGRLFPEYGQFQVIDTILDDLREKMLAAEYKDDE